jgi:hypothetical protein
MIDPIYVPVVSGVGAVIITGLFYLIADWTWEKERKK